MRSWARVQRGFCRSQNRVQIKNMLTRFLDKLRLIASPYGYFWGWRSSLPFWVALEKYFSLMRSRYILRINLVSILIGIINSYWWSFVLLLSTDVFLLFLFLIILKNHTILLSGRFIAKQVLFAVWIHLKIILAPLIFDGLIKPWCDLLSFSAWYQWGIVGGRQLFSSFE